MASMPRLEMVNQFLARGEVSGPDAYCQKIRRHIREDLHSEKPDESSSAIKPDELGKFRRFVEAYGL